MKLAYFGEKKDEPRLKEAFPELEVEVQEGPLLPQSEVPTGVDILSVFVDSEIPKAVLDKLPNVKLITTRSAGVDHIDIETCKARGISVSNVPHYGEYTVAEHTFALLLSLSRKIFQSYERTEKMNFNRDGLQGFDLSGKTLGVIGVGNIGHNVIAIAKGFNMNVVAFDPKADRALADTLGFTWKDSIEEVLQAGDVVTLHVPYLPSTHHLINKESITHMKKGAILINTARGGLVETAALLHALEQGQLSGAGLDVLEGEHDTYDRIRFMSRNPDDPAELQTLVRNHMLVSRDDVIITPHNAYNSIEAVEKIFETTISNIKGFLNGKIDNQVV